MKITIVLTLTILAMEFASQPTTDAQETKMKKLEHTLKTYYLVFLKAGPRRDQDSSTAAHIQAGHLANLNALYEEGKLDIAGPLLDNSDVLGIAVLNVKNEKEAKQLMEKDPAVVAGRLIVEVHPWMSSPGATLR